MTKEECEIETSKAVMEMRKKIAELEKENAEQKEQIEKMRVVKIAVIILILMNIAIHTLHIRKEIILNDTRKIRHIFKDRRRACKNQNAEKA